MTGKLSPQTHPTVILTLYFVCSSSKLKKKTRKPETLSHTKDMYLLFVHIPAILIFVSKFDLQGKVPYIHCCLVDSFLCKYMTQNSGCLDCISQQMTMHFLWKMHCFRSTKWAMTLWVAIWNICLTSQFHCKYNVNPVERRQTNWHMIECTCTVICKMHSSLHS